MTSPCIIQRRGNNQQAWNQGDILLPSVTRYCAILFADIKLFSNTGNMSIFVIAQWDLVQCDARLKTIGKLLSHPRTTRLTFRVLKNSN